MSATVRRAFAAVLALAMTLSLAGSALAAPALRDRARTTRPNPNVVIHGSGWGHGVGMSQYGAYAQSRAGWSAQRILGYYYPGVNVPEQSMPGKIRVGLHTGMQVSEVVATDGPVPWKTCDNGNCTTQITQPEGSAWRLSRTSTGAFKLTSNGNRKWRGGAGKVILAAFNSKATSDGTVVRAYHPVHGTRSYKWGKLEYRARGDNAMYMVLDIPSVDLYLRGLGEMPSGWGGNGGMAALRAQVIAARTYAVKAHRGNGGLNSSCFCSLGATPLHQAYAGYNKELETGAQYWVQAVKDTPRRVITYGGDLIGSFYSSSHGGRSENVEHSYAYGSTPIPYLRSVADPWSLRAPGNPFSAWSTQVSNSSFANFVGSGMAQVRRVQVASRTPGGTPIRLAVTGRGATSKTLAVSRAGSNSKGIVGIDLKQSFGYSGATYSQSTLLSQQVRRIGLAPFTDDDALRREYEIVFASAARLIKPRSSTRFAPSGNVSRADIAYALYRTLQIPSTGKDFYDDDDGMYQEGAINALANAGIVGGYRDRRFGPKEAVNRAQAATFFRRSLGLRKATTDYFSDDNSSAHEANINAMRRKGLMFGCARGKFCPSRLLPRDALAELLYRTVEAYR